MSTTAAGEHQVQRIGGRFAPGFSGNPGGRAAGVRNKINADFLRELSDAFDRRGKEVIERAMDEEPVQVLKVLASLLPRDVQISTRPLSELTDDDLVAALGLIQSYIDAGAGAGGDRGAIEGEATRLLPSVPEAAGVPRGGEDAPRKAPARRKSGRKDSERGS
jgi:hypothetical protein